MAIDPFLVGCALLSFLLHLALRCFFRKPASRLPLPPGPRGVPILGALPLLGSTPHSSLARLARRYGPIMYLKMGTCSVVVASSPSAARTFLKTFDEQFANRPAAISAKEVTYGYQNMVFSSYNAKWKLLRKLTSFHLLGAKALADWAPVRRAEAAHMVRGMVDAARRGQAVTLPDVLVCAFANIISQITLSFRIFDAQGEESNEYKDMIVELLTGGDLFNIGDFVPGIAWMDLQGVQAKLRRIHKRYDAMITRLLDKHAASAKEREGRPDFLDVIMANRKGDDGETITDVNIKALIFDMFTAGTDTSSIIIEWAMTEMLKKPSILRRAQSEMDRVIGRERRLEECDVPKLPYLQAICKEAFRMHPSTPLSLPHFSFKSCEVDGNYYIPENTRLLVNIWAIGRNPDVWENPLEFQPERFLSDKGVKKDPQGNDFDLIPFGAGRRICAGKLVGMVFVQYMLGTLLHSFDWRLPDDQGEELNMDEKFGLALPKAVPLKAMVTPRLAPAAYP